ncbi:MAG: membrane protein insertase YidC [Alphaproteobacteria bacterium]
MQSNDQRNLFMAVIASLAILVGYQYFYESPRLERERAAQRDAAMQELSKPSTVPGAPADTSPAKPLDPQAARASALQSAPRVKIDTPRLKGTIALAGARFDDLTLANHRETIDPNSPAITLLTPAGAAGTYFAELGWVAGAGQAVTLPDENTVWRADRDTLTVERPVTLSWNNGQGLTFQRTVKIDRDYMFTVIDRVENAGPAPVTLFSYGLLSRWNTPETAGFYILHEGPLGVADGRLHEHKYTTLQEDKLVRSPSSQGGWVGISDKYWLVALIPKTERLEARYAYRKDAGTDKYQVDFVSTEGRTIEPGASTEATNLVFAGAKQVRLLTAYSERENIPLFDRAIVFRWLYFVAEPLFLGLHYLYDLFGNFGIAILVLTVGVKLLFFPLANKSYRSMSKMKLLQPEMLKIRERCKDDKQRQHQEMMALYKREKVNPAAGCLPVLVQIPVFFCLYEVLYVTIEMRHAPFFGWIMDLSAPDPTTLFNLFGLIPWTPPVILMIGAWPLIMGVTMFLQQKMSPQPPDPIQARIFLVLPLVFTVMLASFPSGLVIYWAWNNVLSIAQQWVIMKRLETAKKS